MKLTEILKNANTKQIITEGKNDYMVSFNGTQIWFKKWYNDIGKDLKGNFPDNLTPKDADKRLDKIASEFYNAIGKVSERMKKKGAQPRKITIEW